MTEKWLCYPVFDSGRASRTVWMEDRPVWEQLSAANPVEMLEAHIPLIVRD